jgi:hypothetical protein
MSILAMVLSMAIVLQLQMEAALAQMVQRDAERVRFHPSHMANNRPLVTHLCPIMFSTLHIIRPREWQHWLVRWWFLLQRDHGRNLL